MSRSYHENRSRRRMERELDLIDTDELHRKRQIKAVLREERDVQAPKRLAPIPPEAIPILVKESGRHLLYPASTEELQAVMGLLPPGSLSGLISIELSAGRLDCEDEPECPEEVRDPYLGRRGVRLYPGVYEPLLRGAYLPWANRIQLFAYVIDPDALIAEREHLLLRYAMLKTLVHEVAHHVDRIDRTRGERRAVQTSDKAESFADALMSEWCASYVVPYLKAELRRSQNT